jgi:hypothetical protein
MAVLASWQPLSVRRLPGWSNRAELDQQTDSALTRESVSEFVRESVSEFVQTMECVDPGHGVPTRQE